MEKENIANLEANAPSADGARHEEIVHEPQSRMMALYSRE
jgi:hypothetical protein